MSHWKLAALCFRDELIVISLCGATIVAILLVAACYWG